MEACIHHDKVNKCVLLFSGKLASTIPVRFQEQPNLTRSEDTNVFLKGGKPWDPKMYSSQDEPMVG